MPEIRILTALGDTIEIKANVPPGKSIKDLAEEIYQKGFRVPTESGGRIMRVMAVEYTEDTFSKLVKPA